MHTDWLRANPSSFASLFFIFHGILSHFGFIIFNVTLSVIDPLNPLVIKRKIIHLGWGWPLTIRNQDSSSWTCSIKPKRYYLYIIQDITKPVWVGSSYQSLHMSVIGDGKIQKLICIIPSWLPWGNKEYYPLIRGCPWTALNLICSSLFSVPVVCFLFIEIYFLFLFGLFPH